MDGSHAVTEILYVEDNPIDVRLVSLAFKKELTWQTSLTVAKDGEEAIYLLREFSNGIRNIDLVVLDLNLPKVDGIAVLAWIRQNEQTRDLPVVILSSSPLDVMLSKVHSTGVNANGYFEKPMELSLFWDLPKNLRDCFRNAQKSGSVRHPLGDPGNNG